MSRMMRVLGPRGGCLANLQGELRSIRGSSATNVWTVAAIGTPPQPVAQWSTGWTHHDSATLFDDPLSFWGPKVWAADSTHVWVAVSGGVYFWNGSAWSHYATGHDGVNGSYWYPMAVQGFSSSDVYVLFAPSGGSFTVDYQWIHWDGSAWSAYQTLGTGGSPPLQEALSGPSGAALFAAGRDGATPNEYARVTQITGAGAGTTYTSSATDGRGFFGLWVPTTSFGVAVGYVFRSSTHAGFVWSYDGTSWAPMTGPTMLGTEDLILRGVGGMSASDFWVAGVYTDTLTGTRYHFLAHWNGSAWTRTPVTTDPGLYGSLWDVTAFASNDVWAVGSQCYTNTDVRALVLHWDGSAWTERTLA